ncbi:MAG: 3',5'-cyclic-nucleotide phosphodiesterase [Nitrospirota bacterium]
MRIRVIGCSGAEFPGHNAPSFVLDDEIVFDAGSITDVLDKKAQFRIKNIFITHAHLDHIKSIPFLADNVIVGRKKNRINILSIAQVIRTIKRHLFNSSVWPDFTIIPNPEHAIMNLITLKAGLTLRINRYSVTPYRVKHPVPAVGYLVEDDRNKRFFYTGDTGPTPQTWKNIGRRRLNCLIIDVSFPDAMRGMAVKTGHLTPALLRQELMMMHDMPERVYISHPKPQYIRTIRNQISRLKLNNVRILREGDIVKI